LSYRPPLVLSRPQSRAGSGPPSRMGSRPSTPITVNAKGEIVRVASRPSTPLIVNSKGEIIRQSLPPQFSPNNTRRENRQLSPLVQAKRRGESPLSQGSSPKNALVIQGAALSKPPSPSSNTTRSSSHLAIINNIYGSCART